MPFTPAPMAPKCPACTCPVYPAETFMAGDRTPFHKACVKCFNCKKSLNSQTLNNHLNQLFCMPCYQMLFNAQDYDLGSYGGIVTPEDIARKEREEKERLERAERAKREKRCPGCDMKAYAEDSVVVSDLIYHKSCLKCNMCERSPDDNTPMLLGPKDKENVFGAEDLIPYCKFCFAKHFKVSAINIAETVMIIPEDMVMGL